MQPSVLFYIASIWLVGRDCFETWEQSSAPGAAGRAMQLRREASPVVVRHSNKARTGIAFLVSYTARLDWGKTSRMPK